MILFLFIFVYGRGYYVWINSVVKGFYVGGVGVFIVSVVNFKIGDVWWVKWFICCFDFYL